MDFGTKDSLKWQVVIWDFQTNPATSCPFGIKTLLDAKTPHRGSCQHRQQRRPPNGFSTGPVVKLRGWPQVQTLKFATFGSDRSIDLISTSPYICTTNNALASKHSRPQTLRWHRIFLPATEWCQGLRKIMHCTVIWGTDLAKAPSRERGQTMAGSTLPHYTTWTFLPTIEIDSTNLLKIMY